MTHPHLEKARAIVQAHQHLALSDGAVDRLDTALAATASDTSAPPATWAIHAASLALDFAPEDARCIALAWQHQTQRNGRFDPLAWPTEPQDFGLQARPSADAFAACPQRLGLYAVVPDAAWVARMVRAGVPTVQLRLKSQDTTLIAKEVRSAVAAVQNTATLLFINDHWQAAIAAGAYGVHLGQEDLQAADLAAIRAAGLRLGLSSHGYAEMLRAHACHPSYIAIGAVYATTLKRMLTPPQGAQRLKVYQQLLRHVPTVAIGGIDLARLSAVQDSGVGSVAVVRALIGAEDPEAAVRAFQQRGV